MTEPLSEDTLMIGPIALYLYASIDQEDTNWIIILKDVGPDVSVRTAREGETEVPADLPERELTRGWLKASHRALDPKRSTALETLASAHERGAEACCSRGDQRICDRDLLHGQPLPEGASHLRGHHEPGPPHRHGRFDQCGVHSVPYLQQQDDGPQGLPQREVSIILAVARHSLRHANLHRLIEQSVGSVDEIGPTQERSNSRVLRHFPLLVVLICPTSRAAPYRFLALSKHFLTSSGFFATAYCQSPYC